MTINTIAGVPWTLAADVDSRGQLGYRIDSDDVSLIAWVPIGEGASDAEANAARIVACVNAMQGIPDPAAVVAEREAYRAALAQVVDTLADDEHETDSFYCECDNTHAEHGTVCRPCFALQAARAALREGGAA